MKPVRTKPVWTKPARTNAGRAKVLWQKHFSKRKQNSYNKDIGTKEKVSWPKC